MRIVFLGDSITQGCFELTPNGDSFDIVYDVENCYTAYLGDRLKNAFPNANIEIINSGISGNTAEQGLDRMDRDVLAYQPELAVVCFGLNNGCARDPKSFAETMSAIFQNLNAHHIQGVLLTPNTYNTYVHSEVLECVREMAADCAACQNSGEMDRVIGAGIEAANANGIAVCDAYRVWKKMELYGIDTTELLCNRINHPTRKMHMLFADMLYPVLYGSIARLLRK